MSLSIHDLRLSLREKMKIVEDLEKKLKDVKLELGRKEMTLKDTEDRVRKRDEMIVNKDAIIKEKDLRILKLEKELVNLTNKNEALTKSLYPQNGANINKTNNKIGNNYNPSINNNNNITSSSTFSNLLNINNNNNTTQNQNIMPLANISPNLTSLLNAQRDMNNNNNNNNVLQVNRSKRIAISAEPAQNFFNKSKDSKMTVTEYKKSETIINFLKNAIFENDFMKNLEIEQIDKIVDCLYPVEFPKDSLIIQEGDIGNTVYITAEGQFEVIKNSKFICKIGSGKVVGELAILYNCQRTASIRALTASKLWAIDRNTFQAIMMNFGIEKHDEYKELLKKIPIFSGIREDILNRFIDVIDECNYNNDEFIIRQYAKGDTFYVIMKGRAKQTKCASKWEKGKFVRYLNRGDFFGEDALIAEETRGFNVVADDPNGVTCLVLDRQTYNQYFNDPQSTLKRHESIKMYKRAQTQHLNLEDEEELDLVDIRLSEFEILGTLGVGGFGRVELVKNTRDSRTYALKILKKQHVVETKQQDHVLNERNIIMDARSNFICRLYKTFKDKKYLYMLCEVCLGGELWSLLKQRSCFDENETKFYTGCVIEALAYLHTKGIVYRDLKPENIILAANGYCKLVDFGFAKRIGSGKKTWTFCGTPEYVAPEVILNKGHDIAADYWSLGILIFELLCGNPPFVGNDPMNTYNIILKGIEAIDFPRRIPKVCASLIKRLCRDNAIERIGYNRGGIKEVQKHRWFDGFNWENLRNGTLEAPYIPQLKDNTDLKNFEKYDEDNDIPLDDVSGWDQAF